MDIKIFQWHLKLRISRNEALLGILILLLFGLIEAYAQEDDSLNNEIIHGKLPNGFRYYIKPLQANDAVSMQFYVKAGQEMEADDQFQMAHLLEHMTFRNSNNFPGGLYNADSLFNSVGMQGIGRDVYASSSIDYSQYIFNPNVRDPKSIAMGLSWFFDIAGGLKLEKKDMTIEKGALKQEFELRSSGRLEDLLRENHLYASIFPCKSSLSNYDQKVDHLTLPAMKRFYETWYVPGNMAVVIIGNINQPRQLEEEIKTMFRDLKATGRKKKKPSCDSTYLHKPSQFVILEKQMPTDKRTKKVEINFFYKDKVLLQNIRTPTDALESVKQKIIWELIISGIRNQFDDLTEVYNPNFNYEVKNLIKYSPVPAAALIKLHTNERNLNSTLEKLFEKISQFCTYGLSPGQWEKLRNKKLQVLAGQSSESIGYWQEEIKNHFIHKELLDSSKQELLNQWLTEMSVIDFNKLIEKLLGKVPEDIGVITSKKENFPYQENDILDLIQNKLNTDIPPSKTLSGRKDFMKAEAEEALVSKKFSIIPDSLLGKRYQLSNGLEIVLVPDTTSKNKVTVHGFSPLGALQLPDSHFYSAAYSPELVKHSGVGDLNKFELEHVLEDFPNLIVNPYIKASETGIKAEVDTPDIEVLMQLIHLYITDPRVDPNAYSDWKRITRRRVKNPSYDPVNINFNNLVKEYLSTNKIYFSMGNHHLKNLEDVHLEEAINSYKKLFSASDQFTYIISGDFKEESMLRYAQKYLGTLPDNSKEHENNGSIVQKNLAEKVPSDQKTVLKSFSERENLMYSIRYLGQQDIYDWQKEIKIRFLGEILSELAWGLRFKKGFSLYHVFARGEFDEDLKRYELSVKMDCIPSEMEAIKKECRTIMNNVKEGTFSQRIFDKVASRFMKKLKRESANPKKSVKRLYLYYRSNDQSIEDFPDSNEIINYIKSLNLEKMKLFSKEFMLDKNHYEFIM